MEVNHEDKKEFIARHNPFLPPKEDKGTKPVNAAVPVITDKDSNLEDVECVVGGDVLLTVSVEGDEDDFSYQWYSNTEDNNEGGTLIPGATDPHFKPPTDEPGTTWYYVIITNKRNGKTTTSKTVKVTVNAPKEGEFVIVIDISNAEAGDTVTVSPDSGKAGDTVTLAYTVANRAHYNLLDFGGVTAAIASVDSAEAGTRTYTINAADASSNVITITAMFTHTNLIPNHIAFTNTAGHINKTYGDAPFTNAVAAGHSGNGAITYSSDNTAVAVVNDAGQVTMLKAGSTVIRAEKAADAVYAHAHTNYTLTVDPKPVTITGLSAADKQYDGTTTATVSGEAVISGLVGDDDVSVVAGTAAFADKTVGTGKTVTFSGYSLSGADAGNYSLSAQPANATANITAKPVTITGLSAANKQYDGTTAATVTSVAVINGKIDGDDVSANGTAAFADKNAGTGKTVIFSGWSLDGADAGNYSLSAQPANAMASITAKPVTITGLSAANKQYDGTTTATVTGVAVISGKMDGDTVTVSAGTAEFADALVGNGKTVTFRDWSLTGTDAGNYSLAGQPVSVTANIEYVSMVQISAGTFTMGQTGISGATPEHSVTLTSGFYMGKYQVTQALYQLVMGSNPSTFSSSPQAGETQGKRPVERVSWYDVLVFCNKLSVMEGLSPAYSISGSTDPAAWGTVPTSSDATWNAVVIVAGSNGYRLPTEAQWEYACRAGTTTAYNTGDTINDNTGWYSSNSGSKTHEVGLKPANAWGLYDMHGNVWEWCWDWYGSYSSDAQTNPLGASSGTDRVLRGGGWFDSAGFLRSASRDYFSPNRRAYDLGFRLVRPNQ